VIASSKRYGEVVVPEWEGDEPYFDVDFARARSQGKAQVGVAQPRRIIEAADFTVMSFVQSAVHPGAWSLCQVVYMCVRRWQ